MDTFIICKVCDIRFDITTTSEKIDCCDKCYNKEWRDKNKIDKRHKTFTIYNWKRRGVIGDYDLIYDMYINTKNCELCKCKFINGDKSTNRKCLDHCHITGKVRNVCCHYCNTKKLDTQIPKSNKSGIKNISLISDFWRYLKVYNKQPFCFSNKNKQIVLWCKFTHLLIIKK